jgi:hypothetical protein
MSMSKDKVQRLVLQVALALFLLAAGFAAMQFMKVSDLEAASAHAAKTNEETAAALKGAQTKLVAANARLAELEKKQRESDSLKTLLGSVEPQIAPALEAAGRAGKPNTRAAALAGLGLIGQVVHGANNDIAVSNLERALALDKTNCPAGLGVNLSGLKKVELPPECQAFLPVATTDGKPEAKPAAGDAKPEAQPAKPAAPAAPEGAKPAATPAAKPAP